MGTINNVGSANARTKPLSFLDLSANIRQRIYEAALIYCPIDQVWGNNILHASCACKNKPNIQLLLVNRFIRKEAGRVFWSQNRHRFDDIRIFIRVIHDLDEDLRRVIRDVRIYSDPCAITRINSDYTRREYVLDMYQMLRSCTSLERLQVHESVWAARDIGALIAAAPKLTSLTITIFNEHDYFVAACINKVRGPWKPALRGHPMDLGEGWKEDPCYVEKRCAMPPIPVDDTRPADAKKHEFFRRKSYICTLPDREVRVTEFRTSANNQSKPSDISLSTWVERRHRKYKKHKKGEGLEDGYFSD